jgi:viroplasmin and RNaseH domain-containing protein
MQQCHAQISTWMDIEEETTEFKEAVYDWLKIHYSVLVNTLLDKIEAVIRHIKQILENKENITLKNFYQILTIYHNTAAS